MAWQFGFGTRMLLALLLSFSEAAPKVSPEKVQKAMETATDLMSHLTVAMVTDVLDGQVLDLRSSARAERHLLRLGNTGKVGKDAEKAKDALSKKILKQMIWWKAAPEDMKRR